MGLLNVTTQTKNAVSRACYCLMSLSLSKTIFDFTMMSEMFVFFGQNMLS